MAFELQNWIAFKVESVDQVVLASREKAQAFKVWDDGHHKAIVKLDLLYQIILGRLVVHLKEHVGVVDGSGHEIIAIFLASDSPDTTFVESE